MEFSGNRIDNEIFVPAVCGVFNGLFSLVNEMCMQIILLFLAGVRVFRNSFKVGVALEKKRTKSPFFDKNTSNV